MPPLPSPSPKTSDAALEARWEALHAKLAPLGRLLEAQGGLVAKKVRGKTIWCVRFVEHRDGRDVRCSIYVGCDPELLRRVRQFLAQCRERAQWTEQTLQLAKLAQALGCGTGKRLRKP